MPVLFVSTNTPHATATQWQTRLSDLGYDSAVAQFSEPDGQGDSVLKTWYQELHEQVRKMAMFPPVMIGHGEAAWKLCQKYVANQPLSALVLVDGPSSVDATTLPSFEFEPYFPMMVATSKVPSFLLEYKDDIDLIPSNNDNNEQRYQDAVVSWIAESL
ncbi:hypothetical protein K492DRAFT_190250 [Lichtheimia hyalospora FSU 10163]|nr:hypothetical protein K492DRAFT_190250 [Lichtheimia hyalospora FSU 10163]